MDHRFCCEYFQNTAPISIHMISLLDPGKVPEVATFHGWFSSTKANSFFKTFQTGFTMFHVRYADRKLAIRMNDKLSEELSLLIPPVFDQQFHRLGPASHRSILGRPWNIAEVHQHETYEPWGRKRAFLFFWNSIHRRLQRVYNHSYDHMNHVTRYSNQIYRLQWYNVPYSFLVYSFRP